MCPDSPVTFLKATNVLYQKVQPIEEKGPRILHSEIFIRVNSDDRPTRKPTYLTPSSTDDDSSLLTVHNLWTNGTPPLTFSRRCVIK